MAKKNEINLEGLIEGISANMSNLADEFTKVLKNASAARRARKLTSELSKQFKEFRALSVAFHKK